MAAARNRSFLEIATLHKPVEVAFGSCRAMQNTCARARNKVTWTSTIRVTASRRFHSRHDRKDATDSYGKDGCPAQVETWTHVYIAWGATVTDTIFARKQSLRTYWGSVIGSEKKSGRQY
jgi:hypothetical protein